MWCNVDLRILYLNNIFWLKTKAMDTLCNLILMHVLLKYKKVDIAHREYWRLLILNTVTVVSAAEKAKTPLAVMQNRSVNRSKCATNADTARFSVISGCRSWRRPLQYTEVCVRNGIRRWRKSTNQVPEISSVQVNCNEVLYHFYKWNHRSNNRRLAPCR